MPKVPRLQYAIPPSLDAMIHGAMFSSLSSYGKKKARVLRVDLGHADSLKMMLVALPASVMDVASMKPRQVTEHKRLEIE
jgi:hypothetical protein